MRSSVGQSVGRSFENFETEGFRNGVPCQPPIPPVGQNTREKPIIPPLSRKFSLLNPEDKSPPPSNKTPSGKTTKTNRRFPLGGSNSGGGCHIRAKTPTPSPRRFFDQRNTHPGTPQAVGKKESTCPSAGCWAGRGCP